MSQIYHGSNHGYYSPRPPSRSHADKPTQKVGIRLVFDDAGRVLRTGYSAETGNSALRAPYVKVDPNYSTLRLGFRLAREGT